MTVFYKLWFKEYCGRFCYRIVSIRIHSSRRLWIWHKAFFKHCTSIKWSTRLVLLLNIFWTQVKDFPQFSWREFGAPGETIFSPNLVLECLVAKYIYFSLHRNIRKSKPWKFFQFYFSEFRLKLQNLLLDSSIYITPVLAERLETQTEIKWRKILEFSEENLSFTAFIDLSHGLWNIKRNKI